jgi:hypothetical protein
MSTRRKNGIRAAQIVAENPPQKVSLATVLANATCCTSLPLDSINQLKAEHDALVAVAEAANELQYSENSTTSVMGVSVVKQPLMTVLREKLAALAAARQQSPTTS